MPDEVAEGRQAELLGGRGKEALGLRGERAEDASGIRLREEGRRIGGTAIGVWPEDGGDGGVGG